jgi:hypothetical protein
MALTAGAPEPSRFERIRNGDRDHIHGYDDGESPSSERPAGYYTDGVHIYTGDLKAETAEYKLNNNLYG